MYIYVYIYRLFTTITIQFKKQNFFQKNECQYFRILNSLKFFVIFFVVFFIILV